MDDNKMEIVKITSVMLMLLKSDATEENASRVLMLFNTLEKKGCHDICEYYKPDIQSYISRLQMKMHNEWLLQF